MFQRIRQLLFAGTARPPPASPPATSGNPDWQRLGNDALAHGRLVEAVEHFVAGTREPGRAAVAWLNLGYARLELGERDAARDCLRQAVALLAPGDPMLTDAWCLLARERQEVQDWASAREHYTRAVQQTPKHEIAWRELGQVNEMLGHLEEAEACLQRALAVRGDFDVALRDLARLMLQQDRPAEALAWLDRLAALQPPDVDTWAMRADVLSRVWRLPEALMAADRALALAPDARAMNLRAVILGRMGRPEDSLFCFEQLLERAPDYVPALTSSAVPLMRLHRYDEALKRLDRALTLEPGQPDVLVNKGAVLLKQLRCREALEVFDEYLSRHLRNPDVSLGASFALLSLGQYARGWAEYESRWERRERGVMNRRPQFGVPEWNGEPLAGKALLLYTELGLGDTLQCLRFVKVVAGQAGQVWLRVQPAIVPVLGALPANCTLLPQGHELPRLDFVCPLMGLPRLLGTTEETIPRDVPYLRAPDERVGFWRQRLGAPRAVRVGLVWSGNPDHGDDHNRSILLARVLAHAPEGLELFSLQSEVRARDAATLAESPQLRHFGPELSSFGDTAALASQMDLVISVDTSVAHLAGGLGLPLLVLLPFAPDWRWLLHRNDSPWYPSATLFRQPAPGDWDSALAQVMERARESSVAQASRIPPSAAD